VNEPLTKNEIKRIWGALMALVTVQDADVESM
jgi:hypothetical protein